MHAPTKASQGSLQESLTSARDDSSGRVDSGVEPLVCEREICIRDRRTAVDGSEDPSETIGVGGVAL